jgi:hypothetical protein
MNIGQQSHFLYRAVPGIVDHFWFSKNMLPVSLVMSAPNNIPNDDRVIADGRIHPQSSRRPPSGEDFPFHPMSGNDAVVVQPSFDDSMDRFKTPTGSSQGKLPQEWQARSPNEDRKQDIAEPRNPSSPPNRESSLSSRHERNLSAHFFDATTISRDPVDPAVKSSFDDKFSGRKHQRMFSGDLSNPPLAHRRVNSIGNAAAIQRRHHHREGSAGLDILSAAADVSKDDFAAAAGGATVSNSRKSPPMNLQQPSLQMGEVSLPPHGQHQFQHPESHHQRMHPPQPRPSYPHPSQYGPPPPGPYHPSQYPPYPPSVSTPYYPSSGYHPRSMPPHPGYPVQYPQRPHPRYSKGQPYAPYRPDERHNVSERFHDKTQESPPQQDWNSNNAGNHQHQGQHQGSQTFVTAIAVGGGNRTINPTIPPQEDVPSQVGHHRKLSSFSSLGTILGSSVFSPGGNESYMDPLKHGHHRVTSSTVSFLQGMEVGLDSTDDTFLRNLQASNSAATGEASTPTAPPSRDRSTSPVSDSSGNKLATGGTSKRVRRKCTDTGCSNRVVQGGLCIAHGARRKTCKHPGCSKNVKKAGLCSTHGPARRRCDLDGCGKVAVQGGRCIAHGAKKRMCAVPECEKQAILSGMCKKHHDKASIAGSFEAGLCQEIKPAVGHTPTHTRGLSIFQEVSAETVQSLLTDDDTRNSSRPEASTTGNNNDDNAW